MDNRIIFSCGKFVGSSKSLSLHFFMVRRTFKLQVLLAKSFAFSSFSVVTQQTFFPCYRPVLPSSFSYWPLLKDSSVSFPGIALSFLTGDGQGMVQCSSKESQSSFSERKRGVLAKHWGVFSAWMGKMGQRMRNKQNLMVLVMLELMMPPIIL